MDTFAVEMINYSSLPLDQFYYVKVVLNDSVSHTTMAFIYRPRHFSSETSQFEGHVEGHPFVLLNPSNQSDIFKARGSLFFRFLLNTLSIQTMRLLEKREGPLIINWKYVSSDLKAFLFG